MSEELQQKLRSQLWTVANTLRGNMSASDFMYFTLGFIFYKYLSEKIELYANEELKEDGMTFKEAWESDDEELKVDLKEACVQDLGYFVEPEYLYSTIISMIDRRENILPALERSLKKIEDSTIGQESEDDFGGLFSDIDLASPKLGKTADDKNKLISDVLVALNGIDFGLKDAQEIDILGDAYEYMIGQFAAGAGKKAGEFYTPQEVSQILAEIVITGKQRLKTVYDPTCGSGSLLLKFAKILGKENVRQGFYGQEINLTTYNLCRINMFLHDIDYDKFDIANEDTLTKPQHWDNEPFEAIVSNPPYSTKWKGSDDPLLINDPRFSPAGILAPKSYADMAFIMHSLSWLATSGVAAIVCFPGIFYRGGAEQKIRKYLIENNFIDCIIQLPSNLFFGTSIATCIMVLKKSKTSNDVLFIDASAECVKVTNNNKLTDTNIENILRLFTERKDVEYTAKVVPNATIGENDFNLSVSTYVEKQDTREKVDIKELNKQIAEIVAREQVLRDEIDKIIAEINE